MDERALEALHRALWRLERRWVGDIPEAHVNFAYEALPPAIFLPPLLVAAGYVEGREFLDVGCGIGRNLVLAHYLGWRVAGVDIHRPYIEAAKELVPEAELLHSDAFNVSFFDADVVFVNRAMVSAEAQARLQDHVIRRMRPGSLLMLGTTDPPVDLEPLVENENLYPASLWRVD